MLQEVKILVAKEREKLAQNQAEIDKDKSQLDGYKKIKEEENIALKKELDQAVFEKKELAMKLELATERFTKLDLELKEAVRKNEGLQADIQGVSGNLDKQRQEASLYEEQLKREVEDARVEIDDLSDLVKTKDRMLEDQNIAISQIKEKLKEKEEEVKQLGENKNKYRDFYEEKLAQEYEETEKQRAKASDFQAQIQNMEYDYDQMKQELQEAQDALS